MSIKEKVVILEEERQEKISSITKEYREKINNLYKNCQHNYVDYFTRSGTVIPDVNFRGIPYEHRICKDCGKEDTRLVKNE